MKLSEIINSYIEEHNYSVRYFSAICGISPAQMSLMVRGINSKGEPSIPRQETLEKLAAGMGIQYRELISSLDDNALVIVSKDGDPLAAEKQELIDKIMIANQDQLSRIKSIINLVMKS